MRVAIALLLLALGLAAETAHAAVRLAWDCYLPSAQVSCGDLERAFFSNGVFARAAQDATDPADPTGPHASLHVRSMRTSDGVAYQLDVHGRDGSTFTLTDRVPDSFEHDVVLLRLVGNLQKATAHLFALDEPGKSEDGALVLRLLDPDAGPRQARKDDDATLWYLAPSVSFNANSFGITQLHARGGLEWNWSHPAWRLRGWGGGSYRYVHLDDGTDDPEDTYQNVDAFLDGYVVRTLVGGFSLGANPYVMHVPQENYAFRAGTLIGAEWMLAPFLKTDEGNFGVRYEVGADHEDYVHETVLLTRTKDYLRHRARVFGAWHFARVDVNGQLTAQSVVNDLSFSSISTGGGLTWRILDDLSLSIEGEISYRRGLLNEPKDLSLLHPLEAFYGGGSYGDVTYWSWVNLEYVFGNALLLRQDQRWR